MVTDSGIVPGRGGRTKVLADNGYTTAVEKKDGLGTGTLVVTGMATGKATQITNETGGLASNLMPKPPGRGGPPR